VISLTNASAITKRKLAELLPRTRDKVTAWLAACKAAGLPQLYIYEAHRTPQRQAELYAQGRTKKGRKVTNAGPWQSMHQYRLAIDFVPLKAHAKAPGMYEASWGDSKNYAKAQAIAKKHGLRHLSWETPHLEDADFRDWRHAQQVFGKK
jgi:peptidoglycan L-alanyl-D-glutamate endopeptidase CwlK